MAEQHLGSKRRRLRLWSSCKSPMDVAGLYAMKLEIVRGDQRKANYPQVLPRILRHA